MTTKWNGFLKLHDKQLYHIFASYCENNDIIVREIIQFLEGFGCTVNDPERNVVPGQPLLRSMIANGIEQSKLTILFITKQYLSDEFCCFIANLAVWYYIRTRGEHRVLPVILEPCKIPRYLKVFNCIHLWKYATTKISRQGTSQTVYQCQIFARLTKAILDAPPKFKRIRWNGIKTLTWSKNLIQKVKRSATKDKACAGSSNVINPLRVLRVLQILDHCYLNCRYGHCSFACSGRDFTHFLSHMRTCRYRPVKCTNNPCPEYQPKWALVNHLETCQFQKIQCPFVGCHKYVAKCKLNEHIERCQRREYLCPNHGHGCGEIITNKTSKEHINLCLFASSLCDKCGVLILRKDQEEHEKKCTEAETICTFCKKRLSGENMYHHLDVCPMVDVECPNTRCGRTMKRNESLGHNSECLFSMINCPNARQGCSFVGLRLSMNKHKASCQYKLNKCHICETSVVLMELEDHLKTCGNSLQCESCDMMVLRSDWSMHERICPVKHPELYCDVCDKMISQNEVDMSETIPQATEQILTAHDEQWQKEESKISQASPLSSPDDSDDRMQTLAMIIMSDKKSDTTYLESKKESSFILHDYKNGNCTKARKRFNEFLNSDVFDYRKLISSRPKRNNAQMAGLLSDNR